MGTNNCLHQSEFEAVQVNDNKQGETRANKSQLALT